ncbi:hypothetical protein BJ138DRAFT_1162088, partial [Hygrophoropsis aurantiaca]
MFRPLRIQSRSASLRLLTTNRKFSTTRLNHLLERKLVSTTGPAERITPFDETTTTVQIREHEEGADDVFTCDEEPHFLKPELGFGFYP